MADNNDLAVAQQLGEINSGMRTMREALSLHAAESKKSRQGMYDKVNTMSSNMAVMEKSIADLEGQMAKATKSISGFENLKAQGVGAKRAVFGLWVAFGTAILAGAGYVWGLIIGK